MAPPGTGKTVTAQAIAKALGKKIMILSYTDIESKYVGEAQKNLRKAFDLAKKEEAVMFFDEADSLLSKRITSISHSADLSANALRSEMLIQLEKFNGVVIFATNLLSTYDRAFETRILKHIKFALPDKNMRKELIKKLLPPKLNFYPELTPENLEEVAELTEGFSGRDIKNVIFESLLILLELDKETHEMNLLKEAIERYKKRKEEYSKNLKISKEELKISIKENLKKRKL